MNDEPVKMKPQVGFAIKKQVNFPKLPEQKKPKVVEARHEYFKAHICYLPVEKVNAYQIKCNRIRKWFLGLTMVWMGDIRAKDLFRSYAALSAEQYRQFKCYPFTIHPYSKLRIIFEAIFLTGMVISNTVQAVHFVETKPHLHDEHDFIVYSLDLVYVTIIVLNFFTGYVEGDTCQYVVLDLNKIAFRYARTWLLIDVLSAASVIPRIKRIEEPSPYVMLISTKLLRLPMMLVYLDNLLIVLRVGPVTKTLIQIFILIVSYLTWNIFFQFGLEYMREDSFDPVSPSNCSWITIANIWNASWSIRFTYTLDRAVGMLRKNSNINLIQQKFCSENFLVVAWLIAKLLVCHCALKYFVAHLGAESAKAKYFIMTKQVETLMAERKFPPRIKEKILKFYAIRFQSKYHSESKMLACVTGQLREDIVMHTGRQLVRELEFLKQLPRALLLQIGMKLKIVVFIAGDIIFKINTVGDHLYFIDKGSVAIYSESGKEICHLEDGDYFGEIALIMKHCLRTASAVAITNCELFRLDKEDFNSSIACYPTVYENIKKVALNRYERTCVLDEHHKVELIMQ